MKPVTHFAIEAMMTLMCLVGLTLGIAAIALTFVQILSWGS